MANWDNVVCVWHDSTDSKNREESAKLLGCLISSCEVLLLPYIDPVLKVLNILLPVPRSHKKFGYRLEFVSRILPASFLYNAISFLSLL
jgi:hypothetical protein